MTQQRKLFPKVVAAGRFLFTTIKAEALLESADRAQRCMATADCVRRETRHSIY